MESEKLNNLSVAEYLELEKANDVKYEYHDGAVYAMAGSSPNHYTICGNIFYELESAFRNGKKSCRTFNTDAKVRIETKNSYVYPDATVVCGDVEMSDNQPDTIINPTVIIEVLSKSTSAYDRGKKFQLYRKIKSLKEYILIEQDEARIEIFKKQGDLWQILVFEGLDAEMYIEALEVRVSLEQVYLNVGFGEEL